MFYAMVLFYKILSDFCVWASKELAEIVDWVQAIFTFWYNAEPTNTDTETVLQQS